MHAGPTEEDGLHESTRSLSLRQEGTNAGDPPGAVRALSGHSASVLTGRAAEAVKPLPTCQAVSRPSADSPPSG